MCLFHSDYTGPGKPLGCTVAHALLSFLLTSLFKFKSESLELIVPGFGNEPKKLPVKRFIC